MKTLATGYARLFGRYKEEVGGNWLKMVLFLSAEAAFNCFGGVLVTLLVPDSLAPLDYRGNMGFLLWRLDLMLTTFFWTPIVLASWPVAFALRLKWHPGYALIADSAPAVGRRRVS
jgi:hypothetical protein